MAEPPLRLTRRGRGVVTASAATLLLITFWLVAGVARGDTDDPPRIETVDRGETLWEIAVRDDPEGDPRVTVHKIRELNGLDGSIVQPGQRLRLPAR